MERLSVKWGAGKGMEWEDNLPLEFGCPAANLLSNYAQLNSSWHWDTPLLPAVPSVFLLLFCSSSCLPVEPGVWGLYRYRIGGMVGQTFWTQNQECLLLFRLMGFQAWGWGLCQGTALFYPVFPCLLSISLRYFLWHRSIITITWKLAFHCRGKGLRFCQQPMDLLSMEWTKK